MSCLKSRLPRFPVRPWFGTVSRPCSRLSKLEKNLSAKLWKIMTVVIFNPILPLFPIVKNVLIWKVNALIVRNPRNRNLKNAKSQIDNPSPFHLKGICTINMMWAQITDMAAVKVRTKSLSKLMKNRDTINLWSSSTSISHRKECQSVILIGTVND